MAFLPFVHPLVLPDMFPAPVHVFIRGGFRVFVGALLRAY
jgi:hypothetical protein